jgi:uncharacterized membrane protein YoaT (DUF817 family)
MVCLLIQAGTYLTGLESRDELAMIGLFHLLGFGLELFKVHHGSWGSTWRGPAGVMPPAVFSRVVVRPVPERRQRDWCCLDQKECGPWLLEG